VIEMKKSINSVAKFKKFLDIEKERQAAMVELSMILGIDVSFSEDEILKNAQDSFEKQIQREVMEAISKWMK
jgi:DNA-binding ferritin-like protein (Dps family)|tara:strand:- start:119 stop:334 length:216 start_codon:yes stop_codon:yes gene_type:complete